jgi:hypothetical protein
MNNSELHNKLFNDMLKAAVEENLMNSLDTLPPAEVLNQEDPFSNGFYKKLMRISKKYYRKSLLRRSSRIAKRAAVFAAVGIFISLGSLLSVEASRNVIFNSVKEWKADHVDIYFQEKNGSGRQASNSGETLFDLPYLPSGFIKSKEMQIGPLYRIVYQNKENESIVFDQAPLSEEGKMMVDTEHTTYQEISINGQKASLFTAKTADDKTVILWQNGKTSLKISSKIGKDELIRMAENAAIRKK